MYHASLIVDNLLVARQDKYLLKNITFTLRSGQALHLRGNNGIGKTSLLRTLCHFIPPAAGRITYQQAGVSHRGVPSHAMHYLGDRLGLAPALSALDNLQLAAAYHQVLLPAKKQKDLLTSMDLMPHKNTKVSQLSSGQQKRLALLRLQLIPRALWILDEVLTFLDASALARVQALWHAHQETGGMIIFTSHQAVDQPQVSCYDLATHIADTRCT